MALHCDPESPFFQYDADVELLIEEIRSRTRISERKKRPNARSIFFFFPCCSKDSDKMPTREAIKQCEDEFLAQYENDEEEGGGGGNFIYPTMTTLDETRLCCNLNQTRRDGL